METKFIKTKKETNYTVLDNTFIQDTRLSWKAKGVMTYLLSLPDDWVIHLSEIDELIKINNYYTKVEDLMKRRDKNK